MKESYPDDIMLCFVQGFGSGGEQDYKIREDNDLPKSINSNNRSKRFVKQISLIETGSFGGSHDDRPKRPHDLHLRKSLRLSSGEKFQGVLPEARRSLSDRFSVITDGNGKRPSRGFLTIRKTWSTGNFAAGAAGGGGGAPRSAPATPLQLEPHPRNPNAKHDKHAGKNLSGSAPSVRPPSSTGTADAGDGKQLYKSRQKKFQRHFPQVGPDERVLNYYACALVGDLLLQGHLYITKNYFAFYSNVFGYVTKLLIPTPSVIRISKEKVARIIPNAVGVCTRDERHVFGSLLSRDTTYKLMVHVWKAARAPELDTPQAQELRASEVELDASEYSPEDDSSSFGGDQQEVEIKPGRRESEAIISSGGSAVIQPALLAGAGGGAAVATRPRWWRPLLCAAVLLAVCAVALAYKLYRLRTAPQASKLSGAELYSALVRRRAQLHGRAADELHDFLAANLLLLTKVRQSLEALSGVILTDMAHAANMEIPNETVYS